jgi:2-alkenal reductase
VVQAVPENSPAAKAGLTGHNQAGRLGDVIVAVDGRPVATIADLAVVLESVGIGKTVQLTVVRNGNRRNVSVTVQDINSRN